MVAFQTSIRSWGNPAPSSLSVTIGCGAAGGGSVTVRVSRKDPWKRRIEGDHVLVDEARRSAGEHPVALEAPDSLPAVRVELRRRHRVRVLRRPDPELRVVVELHRVDEELVRAPAAGRVVRIRDRDALVERALARAVERELRRHPAARILVVEHDRIAVVVRAAVRRARGRACSPAAAADLSACLAVDGVVEVDPLHVVVRADVALGVGRIAAAQVVDAVEVLDRARASDSSARSAGRPRRPCCCREAARGSSRTRLRRASRTCIVGLVFRLRSGGIRTGVA